MAQRWVLHLQFPKPRSPRCVGTACATRIQRRATRRRKCTLLAGRVWALCAASFGTSRQPDMAAVSNGILSRR